MVCVAFFHCFLDLLFCLRPGIPGSCTEWVLAAKRLGQRPPERLYLLKGLLVFGVALLRPRDSRWPCQTFSSQV